MRTIARFLALTIAVVPLLAGRPAAASTGELVSQLEGMVKGFPGGAAVWVSDPNSPTPLYARGADEEVITASLYKLGVMLEAERRIEAGTLSYATSITIEPEDITSDGAYETAGTTMTIDEALELMITVSDNGTALALYHLLGPENINETIQKAGIGDFHIAMNEEEDNVGTPRAFGQYFTMLAKKQLLSAAASDRMLTRLERQKINDRLPAQLPDGVTVAHKTGNLGFVTHDAGIIYTSFGPRVVVAMTWDTPESEAVDFIANVGSLVYSAILEPPTSARYVVPKTPVLADMSTTVPVDIQVTNAGSKPWGASGADAFGLIWEARGANDVLVGSSASPTAAGALAPNATKKLTLPVIAPATPGDYKVTIGLVDSRGLALSKLGAATASFTLRSHPSFVATADVLVPRLLHRQEATFLSVSYSALPAAGNAVHSLSLGWRAVDTTTSRAVAQGTTLLGNLLPQSTGVTSGTFFAAFVAPPLRGTYRLDYELRERGQIASETKSTTIEIAQGRSYPGDRDSMPAVGPFFGPTQIQQQQAPRSGSPRPTVAPRGRSPSPSPRR